jgi:hypothetical protein
MVGNRQPFSERWFGQLLALLLVVALLVRLMSLWIAAARASPLFLQLGVDGRMYHEWALRIAGGQLSFGEPFYLSPGYPYFLALVYAILGA